MQISERDRSLRIFTTKRWCNNVKKESDPQFGFAKLTPIYRGDIKNPPNLTSKKYFRLLGKTYFKASIYGTLEHFVFLAHLSHAFQCYCYLNLYHVVPVDPWRTAVNKRGKIYSLYF